MTIATCHPIKPALLFAALLALATGAAAQTDGDAPPCGGPRNVQALPQDDGSILVTWDEWPFARAYEVWRAHDGMAAVHIGSAAGDNPHDGEDEPHETTFLDTDTEPGVTYTYHVRALGPPPHFSEVCGEASATAIPVFPTLMAGGVAALGGVGSYALLRRRD